MPTNNAVNLPELDDMIQVEGYDHPYRYGEIANSVVRITNKWYFKHDDSRVVRVADAAGKKKFYRVNSPLIRYSEVTGTYIHRSACVITEDGVWLDKNSPEVVELDGKYYRAAFVIKADDGKKYLITDPKIVKCSSSGSFILKENAVLLEPSIYGKAPQYVHTKKAIEINDPYVNVGPQIICANHKSTYFSIKYGKVITTCTQHVRNTHGREGFVELFVDFIDKTNPQEGRLESMRVPAGEAKDTGAITHFELSPTTGTISIPTVLVEYFTDIKERFIMPRYKTKIEEFRSAMNKNFSDCDSQENVATNIRHQAQPFSGKSPLGRGSGFGILVHTKGDTLASTGGLSYSFGVELETSDGLIDDQATLNALHINAVGDRSIGSGEYVTSPLVGDAGIANLFDICKVLNERTLVDDRCGLHVHVGYSGIAGYDKPTFDRNFLINAIRLGCFIEQELYSCLPTSRKPTLYHCHSIKRYEAINRTNYDEFMGAYIFGPKEYWLQPTTNCPVSMWKFDDYKLNKSRNADTRIGQWQDGRYKWLNLINAFSNVTPHKTIEFRIFPGTTVFEKAYAAVLFSLAFTYVVDKVPKIIQPGITMSNIFAEAFKDYPNLIKLCEEFYEARKKKFNRTRIYPISLDKLTY